MNMDFSLPNVSLGEHFKALGILIVIIVIADFITKIVTKLMESLAKEVIFRQALKLLIIVHMIHQSRIFDDLLIRSRFKEHYLRNNCLF